MRTSCHGLARNAAWRKVSQTSKRQSRVPAIVTRQRSLDWRSFSNRSALASPRRLNSIDQRQPSQSLARISLRDHFNQAGVSTDPGPSLGYPEMSDVILSNNDGPLIWIDCEMTGLNPDTDYLLEIAVIITDGRLKPVDEGIEYIIRTPKEVLDRMDEWCTTTHGDSGLTQSCIDSPHTLEHVSEEVLKYVKKHVPERGAGLLAGSSVHADMRFLYKQMPDLLKHLSYRILDVSSVKEICKRWYPSVRDKERDSRTGKVAHRALDDIQASIRELKFYQDHIFKPVEPLTERSSADETNLIETFNKAL